MIDVRAVLQRLDERLDTGHADDVRAAIDHRLVELGRIRKGRDPALPQLIA